MGLLRRMLRGRGGQPTDASREEPATGERWPRGTDDHLPNDEVERQRALLRADAERLDDELIQRQLRYADRSWTPPPQGGERRADERARGDG